MTTESMEEDEEIGVYEERVSLVLPRHLIEGMDRLCLSEDWRSELVEWIVASMERRLREEAVAKYFQTTAVLCFQVLDKGFTYTATTN